MKVIFMVFRPHKAKMILFFKKTLQGGLTRLEHRIYSITIAENKSAFSFFLKKKKDFWTETAFISMQI